MEIVNLFLFGQLEKKLLFVGEIVLVVVNKFELFDIEFDLKIMIKLEEFLNLM